MTVLLLPLDLVIHTCSQAGLFALENFHQLCCVICLFTFCVAAMAAESKSVDNGM